MPGYWRNLSNHEQEAIARRFWEVGRLTLEHWLPPRLDSRRITRWRGAEVTEVITGHDGDGMRVVLSNSESLTADYIVFACGYVVDLGKVRYLRGVLESVAVADGFPVLDEHFQTTLDGLYITGYSATRDFGPFFGFVKGAPAAATLIVRDLVAKSATRAAQTAAAAASVPDPPGSRRS